MFQIKFKDRVASANILAAILAASIKKDEIQLNNIMVLGIPRGGVICADVVARTLNCNLAIILTRKLRIPDNEEIAFGAIMLDGTAYINDIIVREFEITHDYIEREKATQIQEIKRRTSLYSSYKKQFVDDDNSNLTAKTIILVDDGAATGATIIAASRCIKKHSPKGLIIGLPIAPKDTIELLKREADHVEVVTASPSSSFHSVGQYYRQFNQVTDNQVLELMKNRRVV
jgi:putative phosphoribosyl transferase